MDRELAEAVVFFSDKMKAKKMKKKILSLSSKSKKFRCAQQRNQNNS